MTLAAALSRLPAPMRIPGARGAIRSSLEKSGKRLVVIDDDPTGTQTVHGVRVYMDWSESTLAAALRREDPVFYISTNSRSLPEARAAGLAAELGRALQKVSAAAAVDFVVASRSDSTLRGHFPAEVSALVSALSRPIDGVILVPAFFEAGRYTLNDIHWVEEGTELVAAHLTEFARDPDFGFRHSDLKDWVEEKTRGNTKARDVLSIPIRELRLKGPAFAAEVLRRAEKGIPIVANAAGYEDLEALALGVIEAESRGKRFVYRTAASFVKARAGIEDLPLLTRERIAPEGRAGLVVIGSYVTKTTRQLEMLLRAKGVQGIELQVSSPEVARVAREASLCLERGTTPVIFTSRTRDQSADFLATGKAVMAALCETVRRITGRPSYIIAKGGITSIELARSALGVEAADVLGQVIKGVPVWRLSGKGQWNDVPYIVFPGNVGDDSALLEVFTLLSPSPTGRQPTLP
jgi:uncharacterized protein YgbK (DUF1537 family)